MTNYWLWVSVAGVGALHGLSPATGWLFAAARGMQLRDPRKALWALMPIAIGHFTSIALVAGAFAFGFSTDPVVLQVLAGALLAFVTVHHSSGRHRRARASAGKAGLGLWSFIMSTGHGAGLMLVPVLMPLCTGNGAAREVTGSGSLALVLAAVAIHTVAMIAVTGAMALGVCHGSKAGRAFLRRLNGNR